MQIHLHPTHIHISPAIFKNFKLKLHFQTLGGLAIYVPSATIVVEIKKLRSPPTTSITLLVKTSHQHSTYYTHKTHTSTKPPENKYLPATV